MTGYVRQSAADIVPTGVVRAAPINNELNALRDAFAANGGHKHDGTAAEGHPVPVIGDSDLMNKIATDTSNNRHGVFVEVGGAAVEQVRFQDGAIVPVTDNDVDLGTSSLEFKDLHIDGTANIDSLVADTADINGGTVDGAVIGGSSAAAGSFTTIGATGAITSTVSTGTAPLVIASTTKVSNLNVDQLDGADWAAPAAIGTSTPAAGTFTSLTANTSLVAATADINGGTLDGAVIGASSAQAITGTTVTATTGFVGGLTGNVTGNTTGTHTGGVIGNVTGDVTGNVTASTGTSSFNDVTINGTLNMNAGTSATITNLTSPTNSGDAATKGYVDTADALKLNLSGGTMSGAIAMGTNKITGLGTPTANADAATKVYVDTSISNLVASAPGLLDTLDELAAALGDDPNFATTVTNSIATKLPLAGGTMSGAIAMGTNKITGLGDPTLAQDAATKTYVDQADALKLNLSGGTMSGAIAMGTNKITGLGNPTANQDAATKTYVDTADALKLSLTGGTMSGAIAMGTSKITGLGDPTANQDAATKIYVDGILGSATSAAASAAAAATSASNAATSASNASTSASNAATSASSASTSATSAAASYDAFDDRYLGSKTSAPTLDNDGNALLTGALYWNSTSSELYLWTGSAWTRSALSGTDYVAKSGDTMTGALTTTALTLSGGTANGVTYLNGSKVLTSGSQMQFDGTNLGIGISPSYPIHVVRDPSSGAIAAFRGTSTAANSRVIIAGNASGDLVAASDTSGNGFIYSDTGKSLIFGQNGGTEGMRLTSTGLGIGTSSPSTKLHVYASTPTVFVEGTSTSDSGVQTKTSLANFKFGAGVGSATNCWNVYDLTAGAERLRIDSAGNVGIGTSSPAYKLDVSGTARFNSTFDFGGGQLITSGSGSYKAAKFGSASGAYNVLYSGSTALNINDNSDTVNLLVLTNSGNLGLGVTPSAWISGYSVLDAGSVSSFLGTGVVTWVGANWYVKNTGADTYKTTNYALRYGQSATTGSHIWSIAPSGTAGTAISFTQAMTLDASGNLGVGVTSPSGRLDIGGSGSTKLFVRDKSDADRGIYLDSGTAATGVALVSTNTANRALGFATNDTERARIDSSGNFGIGTTSPSSYGKLAVGSTGSIAILGSTGSAGTTGRGLTLYNSTSTDGNNFAAASFKAAFSSSTYSSGYGYFETVDSSGTLQERARIDSSGNLLVGGTSTLTGSSRKTLTLNSAAGQLSIVEFGVNGTLGGYIYSNASQLTLSANNSSPMSFETGGAERFRIALNGAWGLAGANYGTAGQVLQSNGSGAAPTWVTAAGGAQAFVAFGANGGF